MVLIMLRIKACIPIVIMGETGCGKTSLIRYLASICEIPFHVISIHAGIEENTLIDTIIENNEKALQDLCMERWVFFDEINTSESISLLSEVLCRHCCLGKYFAPNLVFMAACNPYKLRSKEAIFTSGLKSKAQTDEQSRLVYRVHPLPEKLVDYVWDFGSLSENDEKLYIERMIHGIFKTEKHESLLADLLAMSQSYTREITGTSSSVSLRDIQRCKILLNWFIDIAGKKTRKKASCQAYPDKEITSILLALAHCYQSRFAKNTERREYRRKMQHIFQKYNCNDLKHTQINSLITEEQRDILARMELPPGTAENIALRENVFVLLVCILTRIPIFLVGKPGCSKSLSMQVIKSNLRGKDSKDEFFKTLPQLYCVSFQGSESSTSDGIMKVFEKAENYQKANRTGDVLSVVLLDKIGLAEVSRFNPLKVLHNLLEPDGHSHPNVAVVGISNWCLDESKMNRAVHLSRPEMDLDDLHETAISISESFELNEMSVLELEGNGYNFQASNMHEVLRKVASSYDTYIHEMRFKNFHGLRDYYSLVKYFTRELALMDHEPTESDIQRKLATGVQRNFGGLPQEYETLIKAFSIPKHSDKSVMELIKDNIEDELARHLMLITTGESIIGIVEKELDLVNRDKIEVLFGSQFEEDLTDDYNYRILSQIILCMEQGLVLILKDLENIYGSLYDMLNKNYTEIGKKKMCRVALGAYSNPFCHVHEKFKCIVLVDKKHVQYSDPPFLNRFEKHYLQFSDIISEKQKRVIAIIDIWIDRLLSAEKKGFIKEDCFPVYSKDLVVSLVLKLDTDGNMDEQELILSCKQHLLLLVRPEVIVRLQGEVNESDEKESNWIQEFYFELPVHKGLSAYIEYQLIEKSCTQNEGGIKTIIFTSSSVHSKSFRDLTARSQHIEKLGAFKSEKHLSQNMQRFWLESEEEILFMLCSAGSEKHIMLAKSAIERYRKEFKQQNKSIVKHVYFVIHVDRDSENTTISSAINFLSGWDLVMLDSIECPTIPVPQLCKMTMQEAIEHKRPMNNYLKDKLLWAFSRIKYPKYGRTVESFAQLFDQMKQCEEFTEILDDQIYACILKNHPNIFDTGWQVKLSYDVMALKTSCTFVEALEKYILSVIDIPLAKIIFKMENANILDSFFVEDTLTGSRRKTWKMMISNEKLFSISDISNQSGPECYICENNHIFLKLPFSMHIFKQIETTKDDFLNSVALLKNKCSKDEEDELPEDMFDLLLSNHKSVVLQTIPDLADFIYSTDDYLHDFCNLLSYSSSSNLDQQNRIDFITLVLQQKIDFSLENETELLTNLHACYWMNNQRFHGVLHLIEFCFSDEKLRIEIEKYFTETCVTLGPQVPYDDQEINMEHKNNMTSDAEGFPGESLADERDNGALPMKNTRSSKDFDLLENIVGFICKFMLPTIETIERHENPQNWQRKAHTVLTLAADISCKPELTDALCFCNDIHTDIIMPSTGNLDLKWLMTIARALSDNMIDSPYVLDIFMQMLACVPAGNDNIHTKCLKVLSKVSFKCLLHSPTTLSIPFIISCIQENKISHDHIWIFKPSLQVALKLAWADRPEIFTEVLHGEHSVPAESTSCSTQLHDECQDLPETVNQDTNSFSWKVKQQEKCTIETDIQNVEQEQNKTVSTFVFKDYQETDIVRLLDECLKKLAICDQNCLNMSILMVDLLQLMYEEYDESGSQTLSLFLQCHKSIASSSGIQKLACIAFVKTFIEKVSRKPTSDLSTEEKTALTAVVRPSDNILSGVVARYFLKFVGTGLPLSLFSKKYNHLKEVFGNIGEVEWKEEDFLTSFEMCPLLSWISEESTQVQTLLDAGDKTVPLESRIKTFLSDSKYSTHGRISLFAVATKFFYLIRPFQDLNDTRNAQATLIISESKTQNLDQPALQLLERLLGKKDFGFENFMIQEGSDPVECILSTWLATLFSLLIAHHSNSDTEKLPFMACCLFKPLAVKDLYFPGFPDDCNKQTNMNLLISSSLITCNCGHRLAVFISDKTECPICRREVSETNVSPTNDLNASPLKGYFRNSVLYKIRSLSPLSHNILQLMIKGCFLGSFALGFSNTNALEQVTSIAEIDIAEHLWKQVLNHWKAVSKILNVDEATASLILHSILFQTSKQICKNSIDMESTHNRSKWEEEFEETVQNALRSSFQAVKDLLQSFHSRAKTVNSAELCLRELENLEKISESDEVKMRFFFRLTGKPNEMNLVQSVLSSEAKHPFIVLVIQSKDLLHLPKRMLSIIKWHMTVVSKVSYLLKKQELLDMTVADFIRRFGGEDASPKSRFVAFQNDWNDIKESFTKFGLFPGLERVHVETKIENCIYLCENSILYRVLEKLVRIQNDFLDTTLQLGQWCESVSFLRRGHCATVLPRIEVTEANKQNLLDCNFDLNEVIFQDAQCDLAYHKGRQVHYDFLSIERELAVNILVGKAYIELKGSLPPICFRDELFRNYISLVNSVKESVPQEALTHSLQCGILAHHENDPKMASELLTHAGMLMTWLKKTKGSPQRSLVDYIDSWKAIFTDSFPVHLLPSPQGSLLLCHVVALHELLEELCSDSVLDSLEDEFRQELDVESENALKNFVSYTPKAADILRGALKRFIYRCLTLRDAAADRSIISYLSDASFWPDGVKVDNGINVSSLFISMDKVIPKGLTVGHICWTMKTIENELKILKENDLKISNIASGYHSTKTQSDVDKENRRKKALKGLKRKS